MLSGLLILPFCGRPSVVMAEVRSHWRVIFRVALFQTFLLYGLFFWGMTYVPGALAAIIIGASPLFSGLVAHMLMPGDQMNQQKWVSIGLAIAGVVLIAFHKDPFSRNGFSQAIGILLLVSSSVMSAIGNVLVSKAHSDLRPAVLSGAQIFLGGLMLFILSLLVEPLPTFQYPVLFYGAFFYLSAMSAVAFSMWFYLLKQPGVKVSELNLWKFIIPVFGAALSWFILPNESPNWISVAGMVCVGSAIFFYFSTSSRNLNQQQE